MTAPTISPALSFAGASLASLPLDERTPFGPPLGTPLDGPMETARRELWRSGDGQIRVGLWECTPGRFWTVFEGEGEFIRLIAGHLTCVEDDGPTTVLNPGDAMTFPAGWRGEWRIEGTLRKLFAGWTGGDAHVPGAPTTRIDGTAASTMPLDERGPFTQLDGRALGTRGRKSWVSATGGLETGTWECDAGVFLADFGAYGEVVEVLTGEVTCASSDGTAPFTLRTGDFAVFPRGWTGEWSMPSPLRKVCAGWHAR